MIENEEIDENIGGKQKNEKENVEEINEAPMLDSKRDSEDRIVANGLNGTAQSDEVTKVAAAEADGEKITNGNHETGETTIESTERDENGDSGKTTNRSMTEIDQNEEKSNDVGEESKDVEMNEAEPVKSSDEHHKKSETQPETQNREEEVADSSENHVEPPQVPKSAPTPPSEISSTTQTPGTRKFCV